MKSIFDLKTANKDLDSANQGLTNYKYQEIQSLRSVVGSKFPDGEIIYRWSYGANKYWIPNKSYFRIKYSLATVNGVLDQLANLTLAMNPASTIFQTSTYKIADQTVCSITENLPQIDTIKNRQNKSGSWLSKTGQALNWWGASYLERERKAISLGGASSNNGGLYVTRNWIDIFESATMDAADTVAVANNVDGTSTFTFVDAANGDLDLTDISALNVGYILNWHYNTIATGTDNNVNALNVGSGVITAFTGLTITIKPTSDSPSPFAATVLDDANRRFTISISKSEYYQEPNSTNTQTSDLIWKPPLPIFDIKHAMPCAGSKQEITLLPFPDTQWQKNIIQSLDFNKTSGVDYTITILDLRLYILTCDSNKIPETFDFMLDFNEIQCQKSPITAVNQQQSFDVTPSTNAITLAFQDQDVTNNTIYPLTNLTIREHIELNLTRYYIRYEGQVPTPDFDGSYDIVAGTDHLLDIYHRSKVYDGTIFLESPETLEEFRMRGMYIHHPFPKTASSRNTRVYVQVNFSSLTTEDAENLNPFMLLFTHSKKVVILKVVNGKIVSVSPYDA